MNSMVHKIENLQRSIDDLNSVFEIKDYKVKHMNKNKLDRRQNGLFEEAYLKHFETNKNFVTDFLEKDVKLYDICH